MFRRNSFFRRIITIRFLGYACLLILVLVFISTIGVTLLVNSSLFISNLTSDKSTTVHNKQIEHITTKPILYDIPSATSSPSLRIAGYAEVDLEISVFVNGQKIKSFVNNDNEFTVTVPLKEGENSIYVSASEDDGEYSIDSETYHCTYIFQKPILDIIAPVDNYETFKSEILIEGYTSVRTLIFVNNAPAVITSEGGFVHPVRLNRGENVIAIKAVNEAGMELIQKITVFYLSE